jgi:hypothetical protein
MTKYTYPRIPIVDVHINNTLIPNTLIDLGVAINVTTRETMEKLGLCNLHKTPIVLQLAH